jgi:transposase-like protein
LKVITLTKLWIEILLGAYRHGLTVTEACRRYGIARDTFYAYRRRYQAEGLAGLETAFTSTA